ncbi:MAG TPA: tetraacyldisaccharide 4'-kinase [Planctomycetes bacterium]|nr:tetraacyldisaccharide 4'-kinase [Planctomycetota bacterium]
MGGRPLKPLPALAPFSYLYALGAMAKNLPFDLGLRRPRRLPVPVVSIGGLGAGGVGKTPFVLWLLGRLRERGLEVGVLARGYGREPGQELNDEGLLLARRFPGLPQVQEPDRVAGGQRLLREHPGLDLILLDDGFQHRRLARDLDLLCLDGERPFGNGLCLPAGWLREPARGRHRADLFVASSPAPLPPSAQAALRQKLRPRGTPILFAPTRPAGLVQVPGGQELGLGALKGGAFWLLAGIARPERFEALVRELGGRILGTTWLRDHARIPDALLRECVEKAEAAGGRLLLTEKDEARLGLDAGEPSGLAAAGPSEGDSNHGCPPHLYLRVEACPEEEGAELLLERISALVSEKGGAG